MYSKEVEEAYDGEFEFSAMSEWSRKISSSIAFMAIGSIATLIAVSLTK